MPMQLRSGAWFTPGDDVIVLVNGEPRDVNESASLSQLVDLLNLPPQRIAIELNQVVVRRGEWAATKLHDGDKVEIVHFVGGGHEYSERRVVFDAG